MTFGARKSAESYTGARLNAIRRAKIVGGRIIRLPFPSSVDVRAEIAAIMQCPAFRERSEA